MQYDRIKLSYGNGGWVRHRSSSSDVVVYLRYEDHDGQLEPVELYLERTGDGKIDTNVLRDIPLGAIDAWVRSEPVVRKSLPFPGIDLKRAARAGWGMFGWRLPRHGHWVAHMLKAQVVHSGVPQVPLPTMAPLEPVELQPVDATLEVPPAKPYGDDFYRSVAEVYSALARTSRSPAGDIADANEVPVTTVHKWVRVARSRGFLGPARQGKRG